jgi:hypothetical protein
MDECDDASVAEPATDSAGRDRLEETLSQTIEMMLGAEFTNLHHHGQLEVGQYVVGGSDGDTVVDAKTYSEFMKAAMDPTPPPPKHPHLRDSSPDRNSGSSHSWSRHQPTAVSPGATTAASTSSRTTPLPTPKRRRLFKKS